MTPFDTKQGAKPMTDMSNSARMVQHFETPQGLILFALLLIGQGIERAISGAAYDTAGMTCPTERC